MDQITFTPTVVPDSTPLDDAVDYPCQYPLEGGKLCGRESGPYGGRGRKPKFCPDHKATKTSGRTRLTGTSDTLALQALEALVQMHNILAFLSMAVGFHGTAMEITGAEERFREQAITALRSDRKMCERILKGGTNSAVVGLMIAYGTLGASIAPTAINEYRVKKNDRDRRVDNAA